MNDKKRFNGIMLPLPYRDLDSKYKHEGLGAIIGITIRELSFLGPEDIQINYAFPTKKKDVGLFWLENCPDSGPYSIRMCYYWLLPHFSKLVDTEKTAVRVKPSDNSHPKYFDYDIIFWADGKAVPIAQQYSLGKDVFRFDPNISLSEIADDWERGGYNISYSEKIGKLSSDYCNITKESPSVTLHLAKNKLEIKSRDTIWRAKQPLFEGVV